MTLALVFKGPEGLVLAADSRVIFLSKMPDRADTPCAYLGSTARLLKAEAQPHIGAVCHELGPITAEEPWAPTSYFSEFGTELERRYGADRLKVVEFANELARFFSSRCKQTHARPRISDVVFLVAGYDDGNCDGRVFEIRVPSLPTPVERHVGSFGWQCEGQGGFVARLLNGVDANILDLLCKKFALEGAEATSLEAEIIARCGLQNSFGHMALDDCIDLSIVLIETTSKLLQFTNRQRVVAGAITVAAITRTSGYLALQVKPPTSLPHWAQELLLRG